MKIDLAVCAIVKNEAPYIKEWVEYHKMIGVQKFYIYDNESTDNLLSVLAPYIYKGIVEYTQIEGYAKQGVAYNECLEKCRENVKWLAYIDLDEFIVPVKGYSLTKVLKEYEDYPGVGINWVMYDSNGHIEKPKGGVIENYIRCCRYDDHHIKSIVRPSMVEKMFIHYAKYKDNQFAVDENKKIITGWDFFDVEDWKLSCSQDVSVNKLRINHYWSKSYQEVLLKINRGRATVKAKRTLTESMYNYKEYTYDFIMYKFAIKMYPLHIIQNTYKLLSSLVKSKLMHKKYRVSNVKIIYDSSLFDEKWYRKTYSINKNEDCAYHYLNYGWKLGFNPSLDFDGNKYLELYSDVKNANICPLLHYIKWGNKEGRKIEKVNNN